MDEKARHNIRRCFHREKTNAPLSRNYGPCIIVLSNRHRRTRADIHNRAREKAGDAVEGSSVKSACCKGAGKSPCI
jgi:hypothetical protein